MTRRARVWTGATLLLVLAINYALVGFPMMGRAASIKDQTKTLLVKQVKSDRIFKNTSDDYMLDILNKERASIDRRITILNCAAISIVIFVVSWVVFGLFAHRK